MNKKKFIAALFIGVIGLLSLSISFSFAWYASATQLSINTIEISMDGDRELLISATPNIEDFKSQLDGENDGLKKVDVFRPVSSMNSSKWLSVQEDTPKFYDASSTTTFADGSPYLEEMDYGFYQQEFWLMCDDDVLVTLDTEMTSFTANKVKNHSAAKLMKDNYPNLTVDEIAANLDNLVNAMRISILTLEEDFYHYYVIDPNKGDKETVFAGVLDNSPDQYYDSYHATDGNDYEIVYGEVADRNKLVYDEPAAQDIIPTGSFNSFVAKTKAGVRRFNYEASQANGAGIAIENSIGPKDLGYKGNKFALPLERDVPFHIVISVYLEGWDLDCINTTMNGNFLATIGFKILQETY